MTSTTTHLFRPAALIAAAVLVTAVVGCADDSGDDLPPPAPESQTQAAPTSTLDPQHQEILDVYYGSVEAMVAAQQAGDPDHPDLARYLAEGTPAMRNVQTGIEQREAQGTYYEGELEVVKATVTDLDQDAEPPFATIESCLDDSDYQLVDRDDGSPVPSTEPGGRYPVTSRAFRGTDDRWYIAETIAHWNEAC